MAIHSTITCVRCNQIKSVWHSVNEFPKVCGDCRKAEAFEARKAYFAKLDQLSIEERLRKVEEWQYDYQPPTSIWDQRIG